MTTLIAPRQGNTVPHLRHVGATRPPIGDSPSSDVVGIVLAGTYHSADSAFQGSLPRPLLPVAQIPVIGYVLRWLRDANVTRVTICANTASRAIQTCVADGASLSMELDYMEDATPRGPAGCAADAARHHTADTFIVVDGTVIPDFDLALLLSAHRSSGAALTAVVHQAAGANGQGGGRSVSPAGIYAFSRDAFDALTQPGFQDIKEHLIPTLRRQGLRVTAFEAPQYCPRVLNAETYLAVNHWTIERIPTHPEIFERWGPFAVSGDVASHATANIHSTARLVGPVILGEGVTIGANAVIVGPTSIGPRTQIAAGALVSRSVIWSASDVGEGAFVDASVIGDGFVIPAHSAIQGEVKMNRSKSDAPRWRLVPSVQPLQPAPAGPVAGLAFP
jgi:NDP-sugar pyrophosphorylase family protein